MRPNDDGTGDDQTTVCLHTLRGAGRPRTTGTGRAPGPRRANTATVRSSTRRRSATGHIVDSQGRLRPGLPVMMRYGRSEIVRAQTDSRGGFVLHGIRPGLHQLVTEDGAALLRVWRRTASPPSARSRLLLCTRSTTIRGQGPDVCVDHDACIHEGRCSQCRRSGAFWNPRTADAAVTLGFASAISAISAVMAYEDGKDKAAAGFIANPPPQSP